jgi:hypothetical protein
MKRLYHNAGSPFSDRKAKPSMAKHSGQSGSIERKGNYWHIRFLADTPDGRIRKSYPVGKFHFFSVPTIFIHPNDCSACFRFF